MAMTNAGKIKRRVFWIELMHWKKIGPRLLWRAVLMNGRLWARKWKGRGPGNPL